jgi:hypothetical protein
MFESQLHQQAVGGYVDDPSERLRFPHFSLRTYASIIESADWLDAAAE